MERLGFEGVLYRFTAVTVNTPPVGASLTEIDSAADVQIMQGPDQIEFNVRRHKGAKADLQGLSVYGVEVTMANDPEDSHYAALLAASQANTMLGIVALNQAWNNTPAGVGLIFQGPVFATPIEQPIGGVQMTKFVVKNGTRSKLVPGKWPTS